MGRGGIPPWPSAVIGISVGPYFLYPMFHQLPGSGMRLLSLSPQDINVAVIGITAVTMASYLQFLIQIIKFQLLTFCDYGNDRDKNANQRINDRKMILS